VPRSTTTGSATTRRSLQPGRAAGARSGSEHIEDQEIYRRLSVDPGSSRFVAAALAASQLITLRGEVPPIRPDRVLAPGRGGLAGYVNSNADGDDGGPLTDYDIIGSAAEATGVFALGSATAFNFLCIPPPTRDVDLGPSACSSPTATVASGARCWRSIRRRPGRRRPMRWRACATGR
jgi:hypothetical protein